MPRQYALCAAMLLAAAAPVLANTTAPAAKAETNLEPPGVFECDKIGWFSDCERVNREYRKNDQRSIRIIARDGLELNFPPGTPAPIMRFYTLRTPETAREMIDYLDRLQAATEEAQDVLTAELKRRGRLPAGVKPEIGAIDYQDIKVYAFYDSNDPVSQRQLIEWMRIKKQHPRLFFSVLQLDNSPRGLGTTNYAYDLDATQLSPDQSKKYRKQLKKVPALWIQSARAKTTYVMDGFRSSSEVARELALAGKRGRGGQ